MSRELEALLLDEYRYRLASFVEDRRYFVAGLELTNDAPAGRHREVVLDVELPRLADGKPDVRAVEVARQREKDAVELDGARALARWERDDDALEWCDYLLKGS